MKRRIKKCTSARELREKVFYPSSLVDGLRTEEEIRGTVDIWLGSIMESSYTMEQLAKSCLSLESVLECNPCPWG